MHPSPNSPLADRSLLSRGRSRRSHGTFTSHPRPRPRPRPSRGEVFDGPTLSFPNERAANAPVHYANILQGGQPCHAVVVFDLDGDKGVYVYGRHDSFRGEGGPGKLG